MALADLYREQTPSASVRAALLKLVATRSHVRDLGVLTDRAGRSGQALEVSSSQPGGLPARFVIIIDQSAGRLLSYEQTLTSDLGKLDVKIPAIIDYTLYR